MVEPPVGGQVVSVTLKSTGLSSSAATEKMTVLASGVVEVYPPRATLATSALNTMVMSASSAGHGISLVVEMISSRAAEGQQH